MFNSSALCEIENIIKTGDSYPYIAQLKKYDQNTYQHSVNVCVLSYRIGTAMTYNEQDLYLLAQCGLMHDIGKIYMPRKTLFKKGILTDNEYDFVKKHTLIGYELVKNRTDIAEVIKHAILCHHENEDGSGYPNHRTANQTHEFAKIVHICDVYDAMISSRSYKDVMAPEIVSRYMEEKADKMFNKKILNIFFSEVFPTFTAIRV